MPLAERVEGRDFRILAIKYFSGASPSIVFAHVCPVLTTSLPPADLARGKPFHLPRIGSVHVDLSTALLLLLPADKVGREKLIPPSLPLADRLDKQEVLEEQRKDLPDEEEIAVLGPDNPDEDAVDEVDLDTDDAMSPRSAYGGEWTDKIIGADADPDSVSSSATTDASAGDKDSRPDRQAVLSPNGLTAMHVTFLT
jgi:hypothetical protein